MIAFHKKLKALYKDLYEYSTGYLTKDEYSLLQKYFNALRSNSSKELECFLNFGKSVRHRIMNANEFHYANRLGFTNYTLNEHGWLNKFVFSNNERIEITPSTHIVLAESPNGRWIYRYSYEYWNGGGSSPLSVFCTSFAKRKDAMTDAFLFLQKRFRENEFSSIAKDREICRKTLSIINNQLSSLEKPAEKQLLLF